MMKLTSDQWATIRGITGAILVITLMCLAVSSCSGCAQPASADDRGVKAALQAIDSLPDGDTPQESAAPPVELGRETHPPADVPEPPKYFPPEESVQSKPCILLFTARWCRYCPQAKANAKQFCEANGFRLGEYADNSPATVHVVHNETDQAAFDTFKPGNILPCYIKRRDGREVSRRVGVQTPEQLLAWYLEDDAPEVATSRPFSEPWRTELLRKHGRLASAAHTNLDVSTVALPDTRINLREQCVEFSGASRDSRLNRWFSVVFGAGSVSHSGTTVNFSNPPELHFHLFDNGKPGVCLDKLEAISFEGGAVVIHTLRFKAIHFKVN